LVPEICMLTYALQIISVCLCSEVALVLLVAEVPREQELQYSSDYKTD